jgi:hypothetical protein
VLVELGVVEQRYRAVLEVLDEGATVTDVARRYGVARQTVQGVQSWACRVWACRVDTQSHGPTRDGMLSGVLARRG